MYNYTVKHMQMCVRNSDCGELFCVVSQGRPPIKNRRSGHGVCTATCVSARILTLPTCIRLENSLSVTMWFSKVTMWFLQLVACGYSTASLSIKPHIHR